MREHYARAQGSRTSRQHALARRGERGSSRLKALFFLVTLIACGFVGIKVVPVLLTEYEFQDAMQTTARYASANRQSADDIRKDLIEEAAKDEVPVKAEDITVSSKDGYVAVEADYSVTVDLALYQWTFNFHPSASNRPL